jgi:hypothetical protein
MLRITFCYKKENSKNMQIWVYVETCSVTRDTEHLKSFWIREWRRRRVVRRDGRSEWIHNPELTWVCGEPPSPDRIHCPWPPTVKGTTGLSTTAVVGKAAVKAAMIVSAAGT